MFFLLGITALAAAQQALPFQVISRGESSGTYQAFPDACRLKNGEIVSVFYAGYGHVSLPSADWPKGGRICMVRSSDEGRNWSAPEVLFDDGDDNRDPHIAQLDDGSLVCTFFSWHMDGPKLNKSSDFTWKIFNQRAHGTGTQMVRSTDNGRTWGKTAQSINKDWYCSAPVRQLPDGTCLLGLYQEDRKTKSGWGGVTRSTDHGQSWSEPSPIGKGQNLPLDAETDLIRLKDGTIFAALRSSKINMHYATSADDGKTFSDARDIGFKAHCPHLNRLSTGEIVLAHRLPNTSIHVSSDEGKTWRGPYEIDSVIGAYPATVELKDHTILIMYYSEGERSAIRAMRFQLKPEGIERLAF